MLVLDGPTSGPDPIVRLRVLSQVFWIPQWLTMAVKAFSSGPPFDYWLVVN